MVLSPPCSKLDYVSKRDTDNGPAGGEGHHQSRSRDELVVAQYEIERHDIRIANGPDPLAFQRRWTSTCARYAPPTFETMFPLVPLWRSCVILLTRSQGRVAEQFIGREARRVSP